MSKVQVRYKCTACDSITLSWQGQCFNCKSWNTLEEFFDQNPKKKKDKTIQKKPIACRDIVLDSIRKIPTHIYELDTVLGGGFVQGSIILLGGEPGIGKSTLSLQLALQLAKHGQRILYISAEESESQLYLRAKRLGDADSDISIFSEHDMTSILQCISDEKPDIVILDSIQMVSDDHLNALPGSVSQVKHCAAEFISLIKQTNAIGLLIGHITKEGHLAGPKTLEHMVDVILYIEGNRDQQYRILRSYKNRYFSTHDIGLFEMKEKGLIDMPNPSFQLIDEQTLDQPGSVIAPVEQGSRVILVELQALVVKSSFGLPKRNVVGVNVNRANLMIATIEKKCRIPLSAYDIFLNVVGGLSIQEPALDLAIVMAIMSSYKDLGLKHRCGFVGEVGLTGEIRSIPNIEKRLKALKKLGFNTCYVPKKNSSPPHVPIKGQIAIDNIRSLLTDVKWA